MELKKNFKNSDLNAVQNNFFENSKTEKLEKSVLSLSVKNQKIKKLYSSFLQKTEKPSSFPNNKKTKKLKKQKIMNADKSLEAELSFLVIHVLVLICWPCFWC